MSEMCSKCNLEVLAKEACKCCDCPLVCHIKCAGVLTRNKKWKCDSCVLESSSNGSKVNDAGATTSSILEAINAFRRENNEKWDCNAETLNLVRGDMTSIKNDIEGLKAQLEVVREGCSRTSENVEKLKEENKRLGDELTAVKQQVTDLEQHTRKNNILISGVPVTAREDMRYLLNAVAKALDLGFYNQDISAAHRLRSKKGDTRPPSIVVCFVSRWVKDEWLAARRKKRTLTARELAPSFPDTPVYLNEHLTPQTRLVFNGARDLVKDKKLSSVWTSDCRVMAKVTPELRPFKVRDLQHVADLSAGPSRPQPPTSSTTAP